jgi:hypothetical protein
MDKLEKLNQAQLRIDAAKSIEMNRLMNSDNPGDLVKANQYFEQEVKSFSGQEKFDFVTPQQFMRHVGYKDRSITLTYDILRQMAKTPIINAIIRTRTNEVADYAQPIETDHGVGFGIRKRKLPGMAKDDLKKLTLEEEREIYTLTEFLLNCGFAPDWESRYDLEDVFRMLSRDSLSMDQYTFEVVYDRRQKPYKFQPVDAAHIRIADSFNEAEYEEMMRRWGNNAERKKKIAGYRPSYVQIYNEQIITEYYPWELCFGVRNPVTDIYHNGYGISELEEMISIVTSMIWGFEYNQNFFKNGSMPKGFFRINGSNPGRLMEFKQFWWAMMRGVYNSWRTPFLDSKDVEWVDMHKNNRDMEFSHWLEFLIKIGSAIFCMDPAQINFPMNGSSHNSPMFEENQSYKIGASRDKGLYPQLRHLAKKINRFLIWPMTRKYEFYFGRLEEMSKLEEMEYDEGRVRTYMTVDELRAEKNMPPLGPPVGDQPANPALLNLLSAYRSADAQNGKHDDQAAKEEEYKDNRDEEAVNKAISQVVSNNFDSLKGEWDSFITQTNSL